MSNVITIQQIHLSFVWTESIPVVLSVAGRNLNMGFLGQRQLYGAKFDEAQTRNGDFEPPWIPQTHANRDYFWYYYLDKHSPDEISGDDAWRQIIPLRVELPMRVRLAGLAGGKIIEAFHYPHGVGFILNLILKPNLALTETVDYAIHARRERCYQVKWEGKTPQRLTLDELATSALYYLRRQVTGVGTRHENSADKPFTIATIVSGAMERPIPLQPVANHGEIHLALQGLSTFSPTWCEETTRLPALKDCVASVKAMPDDHVVYGFEQHRVVWFPKHFMNRSSKHHTLSSYHRNLTMLTLQTDMLNHLMALFVSHLEEGTPAPPALYNLVENGASIVSRLHGGVEDTYQSWSARTQIESGNAFKDLKRVRRYLGWEQANL